MGAISFNLDTRLVCEILRHLPLKLFVETGTFRGETLEVVQSLFEDYISIELSPEYHAAAQKRFAGIDNIRLLLGDSAQLLKDIRPSFEGKATLFWLDAHWCAADDTAGEISQCPLLGELAAIESLNERSVILIDDARLFLTPPPKPHEISCWPDLGQLLQQFSKLSGKHVPVYYNDTLLFIPDDLLPKVRPFLQEHTFNLLTFADKVRNYDSILEQAKDKDDEIRELAKQAKLRLEAIQRLDAEIIHLRAEPETEDQSKTGNSSKLADDVISLRSQLFESQRQLQQVKAKLNKTELTLIKAQGHRSNTVLKRYITRWQRHLSSRCLHPLAKLDQYPPRSLRPERFPRKARLTKWPRICVVTPSFQQGQFLERTMFSVLDQGYPNLAYGVQDGGSTDGSVDIINRHISRLSHAESTSDDGQSDAIQRGFAKLFPEQNDIMCWLNSDDILMPGVLHYIGAYFAKNPDVDVVYGHRVVINEQDQEIGRWFLPPYHNNTLKWFDLVPQETMFWRSQSYQEIGGIDESFQFALDWDLLLRFEHVGCNIRRLPYFLGCFRAHSEQKTSAKIQSVGEEEMEQLRRRTHERQVSSKEILKHLDEEINRSAMIEWLYRYGVRY